MKNTMRKIMSFLILCLCLAVVSSLLSTLCAAQQRNPSSKKQTKKTKKKKVPAKTENCPQKSCEKQEQTEKPVRTEEMLATFEQQIGKAATDGSAVVIVGLQIVFVPEGNLTPAQREAQRAGIAATQDTLLVQLAQFQVSNVKKFKYIPSMGLTANAAAIAFMRDSPLVSGIQADAIDMPHLNQSIVLIGTPNAWTRGFSGAGQTLAILDTGVDKNHPFLRNKVIFRSLLFN